MKSVTIFAVTCFTGFAITNLENTSYATSMNRFPLFVMGYGPEISVATIRQQLFACTKFPAGGVMMRFNGPILPFFVLTLLHSVPSS